MDIISIFCAALLIAVLFLFVAIVGTFILKSLFEVRGIKNEA